MASRPSAIAGRGPKTTTSKQLIAYEHEVRGRSEACGDSIHMNSNVGSIRFSSIGKALSLNLYNNKYCSDWSPKMERKLMF